MLLRSRALLVVGMALATWGSLTTHASAEVVRLVDLERKAVEQSLSLRANDARARGADADIRKASAAYYPQLWLRGNSGMSPGGQLVNLPNPGNKNALADDDYILVQGSRTLDDSRAYNGVIRSALQLELASKLYDFGRTAAAVEAGRSTQRSVLAQREAARSDVVRMVRVGYLAWLNAHQVVQFSEQAAREAQQRRERVEALISEGVRPATELAPARTDELLNRLELERARGELSAARLALEHIVGHALPTDAEPELDLLKDTPASKGVADDPALRALQRQREAALSVVRMHQRERAPDFTATIAAGVRMQTQPGADSGAPTNTLFPLYAAGLNVAMPLWDGGLSSASVASAKAKADALAAEISALEKQRGQERKQAALDVQNAQERLDIAQQLLEVCKQRLTDVEAGYELAASTLDQIAQARAMLRRAQTEVLMAKLSRTEAHLRLAPVDVSDAR